MSEGKWQKCAGEKKHLDLGDRWRMPHHRTTFSQSEMSKQNNSFQFQAGDLRFDGNMKWVCISTLLCSKYITADLENIVFKPFLALWEKKLFLMFLDNIRNEEYSLMPHIKLCSELLTKKISMQIFSDYHFFLSLGRNQLRI